MIGWLLTGFSTLHDYMSKCKLKHTYWPNEEGKLGTRFQPTSTSIVEDSSSSFLLLMAEIFRGGLCSGGRSAPSYNLSQHWLNYVLLILTAYGLSKINI